MARVSSRSELVTAPWVTTNMTRAATPQPISQEPVATP